MVARGHGGLCRVEGGQGSVEGERSLFPLERWGSWKQVSETFGLAQQCGGVPGTIFRNLTRGNIPSLG